MEKFFIKTLKESYKRKSSQDLPLVAKITLTNSKLKKDKIAVFSLPAGLTCPGAADCSRKGFCFAMKGHYLFDRAMDLRIENYLASKKAQFTEQIVTQLLILKPEFLRIHDSGDFYGQDYLKKWVEIALRCPFITFYAYTKSLHLDFSQANNLKNFKIIQSDGGKYDHLIKENFPLAKIFESEEEMVVEGFQDASSSDLMALKSKKIGLIPRRGTKAKLFKTA